MSHLNREDPLAPVRSNWASLAKKHWPKPVKTRKVQNEVIETEIWQVLEQESFEYQSLLILESLQALENYLWPGYNEGSTNHHVLLLALLSTVKSREKLPVWDAFTNDSHRFSSMFRRILSMSLDTSLSVVVRTHLLSFLICAFQSLDNGLIRKECAPLVSISIWWNLDSDVARERYFRSNTQIKRAWRASNKRYDSAEPDVQAKLRFERSWLYSMMLGFSGLLEEETSASLLYCERFLEFLTDLESQLPTRRYVNTLLNDFNILAIVRLSLTFKNEANDSFRDLFTLFCHFVCFPIDDHTGSQISRTQSSERQFDNLARLQRVALKHFKSKLTILALANYGSIDDRSELESHLSALTESELAEMCALLGFRTHYPSAAKVAASRELWIEVLVSAHEKRITFQEKIKNLNTLPTEETLYEPDLLRNDRYDGSRSLSLPKLNLQYLSVGDFLWRTFILYRCESFFEIRNDMEAVIKQVQPSKAESDAGARFDGFSKWAIPIAKPAVIEVAPPKVGKSQPAFVRAEIILDTHRLAGGVRREWELLKPEDTVYLLAIQPSENRPLLTNGHSLEGNARDSCMRYLRTAEVVQLLDDHGRSIRETHRANTNGHVSGQRLRRLIVNMDATQFKLDSERKERGQGDLYESINLIVRRKGGANNSSKILKTIQGLVLSDVPMPAWLQEVFLGYGDPIGASYPQLPNRLEHVDFRDTFLDWQHLVDSFPGKTVEKAASNGDADMSPPYVLEMAAAPMSEESKPSKKRRRGDDEPSEQQPSKIAKASTYHPPNNGPYPSDALKLNKIRFTPKQTEAIVSGTQPGLTVIVGPPGTGKTDVATQIISNIYHNFPKQRTVLIAHSNQALNQLFQKITTLDIDARHILRLGYGEEDLETEASYSKYGRVESFLDERARFLAEVDRLGVNLNAPGAHGNSCETAGYFNSVYVRPAWTKFWDAVSESSEIVDYTSAFPFYEYFSNAPQPIFPPTASLEEVIDIAKGCERHIERVFGELEIIRPFEILRTLKDKTNYLMIKEARITAMTSTHAAIRRQEMVDLGFHYENIIMEEAAQITEIENFIPLTLQKSHNGDSPLQRVILLGDHLQNSPVVQNLAFRQFANLEQSLFLRFVRLGVPTIDLDCQGRARPSIASIYCWRYKKLDNLQHVKTEPEYLTANAGFKHEFQFINVSDYKGKGETQPSRHFLQNLGEAEYAVAIYQYMRLLGYPAMKVSILTTYAGQRALIRDVLNHRCAKNKLFGLPRIVTTVDKYQGEQNDYVILSLTRTFRAGYLRDIRRLTVALSRARLGLYVLGRREVFEACHELRELFHRLLSNRSDQLVLVTNELYDSNSRLVEDEVNGTEMTGVEHLGQYVYEMTQVKTQALKAGGQILAITSKEENVDMDEEEEHGDDEYENGETIQPDLEEMDGID